MPLRKSGLMAKFLDLDLVLNVTKAWELFESTTEICHASVKVGVSPHKRVALLTHPLGSSHYFMSKDFHKNATEINVILCCNESLCI